MIDSPIVDGSGFEIVPVQKIYFGPPGTGKSHRVGVEHTQASSKDDVLKTVFHPAYRNGDFAGKLLPLSTDEGRVQYKYYAGDMLNALARAYYNLIYSERAVSYLVIDELNRGNAASIFGKFFQLLDRNEYGWSSYYVTFSEMEVQALARLLGFSEVSKGGKKIGYEPDSKKVKPTDELNFVKEMLDSGRVYFPPNFSIIGTINTSDESIYYMDSAFKRRWDWEYVENVQTDHPHFNSALTVQGWHFVWVNVVDSINNHILENSDVIPKVEDKTIGYWFIKSKHGEIPPEKAQDSICFHLWDSVYQRTKRPLEELLGLEANTLKTYADFNSRFYDLLMALGGK